MKSLKPCSKCGGTDIKKVSCLYGTGFLCRKCLGQTELFPNEETARKEWNRKKRK